MKTNKKLGFVFSGFAGAMLLSGCLFSGDGSSNSDSSNVSLRSGGAPEDSSVHGGVAKVTICHVPPGNPANAHSITVGAPAVRAHLAHGDYIGACGEGQG